MKNFQYFFGILLFLSFGLEAVHDSQKDEWPFKPEMRLPLEIKSEFFSYMMPEIEDDFRDYLSRIEGGIFTSSESARGTDAGGYFQLKRKDDSKVRYYLRSPKGYSTALNDSGTGYSNYEVLRKVSLRDGKEENDTLLINKETGYKMGVSKDTHLIVPPCFSKIGLLQKTNDVKTDVKLSVWDRETEEQDFADVIEKIADRSVVMEGTFVDKHLCGAALSSSGNSLAFLYKEQWLAKQLGDDFIFPPYCIIINNLENSSARRYILPLDEKFRKEFPNVHYCKDANGFIEHQFISFSFHKTLPLIGLCYEYKTSNGWEKTSVIVPLEELTEEKLLNNSFVSRQYLYEKYFCNRNEKFPLKIKNKKPAHPPRKRRV